MKRVVLDYDEASGAIYDATGICICYWNDLVSFEEKKTDSNEKSLDKLTKLRAMNLSVGEMKELQEMGLL